MDKQKELKIYQRFPKLYQQALAPEDMRGCLKYGLSVGDGWHDIIANISQAVEDIAKKHNLSDAAWPMVTQVKEKFGKLVITFDCRGNHDVWKEVVEAKTELNQSEHTCERCGAPGTLHREGWWHVHCDHCEGMRLKGLT